MFRLRVKLETDDMVTVIDQRVPNADPNDHEQLSFDVLREVREMFAVMMPAGSSDAREKTEF